LDAEVITIVQHYRDRADCENNFCWSGQNAPKL